MPTIYDTFDTDSVAAAGITFSNGDLTALAPAGSGRRNTGIAQAREGKKSGKWLVTFTLNVSGTYDGVGISNSSGVGYDFLGGSNNSKNWGYTSDGTIFAGGGSLSAVNNTTYTTGDVIDLAIDLDNSRLWWRKNGGSWVGTSGTPNPATNTGGFDISGATANNLRVFPAVSFGAITSQWTADFSSSAGGGSVPAGFTAGWTNTTAGTYFGSLLIQANTAFGPSGVGTGSTGPQVTKYISSVTGMVSQIVFGSTGGSGTYECLVYDATGAGGGPGALLAVSTNTITSVGGVAPQEAAFTFSGLSITSGTTYWIGWSTLSGQLFYAATLATGFYSGNTNLVSTPHPNPFVIAGGSTVNGRVGALIFAAPFGPTTYDPPAGAIVLTGHAPALHNVQNTYSPPPGGITLTGQTPNVTGAVFFDVNVTVISQYANSPSILQMVQNFANWIAPGKLLNDFYVLIWNIDSAVGYGLDVWGRIVGVGRVLHVATDALYFGFQEASAGDHVTGFNQAPFYGGQAVTANFSLSDGAYRQLILAKAAANICNGSIPAINQVLIDIFGSSGNAYVVDNEDMTMVYHFTFPLDPVQEAIVNNSGVLPKPAGVLATVYSP